MWKVETFGEIVDHEIDALPADMRARLGRVISIISEKGLDQLPRDLVAYLGDRLWELRIRGRDGISRAIYVKATGQRVVLLRVFVKKTQKTPPRELRLARERARSVE